MRQLENEARDLAPIVAEAALLADAQGQIAQWSERLAEIGNSITAKKTAIAKADAVLQENWMKVRKSHPMSYSAVTRKYWPFRQILKGYRLRIVIR
ncbi:hypothetical protein GGI1_20878 [Acidithiobacillus sp. GGI-221]|nr:hypothetical protein GGI1_20878 [Acidithiobacillus sp. GGI-221]